LVHKAAAAAAAAADITIETAGILREKEKKRRRNKLRNTERSFYASLFHFAVNTFENSSRMYDDASPRMDEKDRED